MKHLKDIIKARNIAVLVVVSVLALDLFINKVTDILRASLTPINFCHLILFFATLVLVFLWYDTTRKDLKYANQWLDPQLFLQPGTTLETFAILANAITLLALLLLSGNPFSYGILVVPYGFITSIVDKYAREIFRKAIDSTQKNYALNTSQARVPELKLRTTALQVLRDYYVSKPFGALSIYSNSMKAGGLILAIIWRNNHKLFAGILAYSLYILSITATEMILWSWRIKRDKKIAYVRQELEDAGIVIETDDEGTIY